MPHEQKLVKEEGYFATPTVRDDEILVEYRLPNAKGIIRCHPDEYIIYDNNVRSQRGVSLSTKGTGRYIVRKKEPIALKDAGSIYQKTPTVEVNMAEQKPLSYKRETLIDALKNAVTENENKRAEDKRKKQEKDQKAVNLVIEMMRDNPRFAGQMLAQAAALAGNEIRTSDDVGTESFKRSVREMYPDPGEIGTEPDAELKKLIRVYEKAEDETVEVHVHDTVYNYL